MADLLANLNSNDSSVSGPITNNNTQRKVEHDPLISNPFYITVTIFSTIGNLSMVFVILCKKQYRKPVNLLIANLSLASFLWIVSCSIRVAENSIDMLNYSDDLCRALSILHRLPVPVIALTTMAISLDRGRIARNPILASNRMNPALKIAFIWIFSVLILLPLGLTRKYNPDARTLHKCKKVAMMGSSIMSLLYGLIYFLSVHVIPAVMLIREITKTINKIKFLKLTGPLHGSSTFPNLPDNRLRLLRNATILSLIFLFFWLPYGTIQFPLDFPPDMLTHVVNSPYFYFYMKFIRNINYAVIALNPVIIFLLSYDVLKHVPKNRNCFRISRWRI